MSVLLPSKPIRVAQSGGGSAVTPSDLVYGDSGIYIRDNVNDASIQFNVNGGTAMTLDKFKRLGINTRDDLTYRLEINDPEGECIKLLKDYGIPAFIRNTDGNISLDVSDRSVNGVNLFGKFFLNEDEVVSPATKLNYTNVFETGTAERNKCLVLDSNKSAYGINVLSVNDLVINNSLTLDMNSDRYSLNVKNSTGKCLKLYNDELYTEFNLEDTGELSIYNTGPVEINCVQTASMQYPLQLCSRNASGLGIKFNAYSSQNIKRNMSSIETIITNNQDSMENSIIKFNNMKDGALHNTVTIRNDGYIVCNTLLELSDMRKKKIVRKSCPHESLDKINQIKIYDFVYISDEHCISHRGMMAQELHKVIPSAVNVSDEYTVSNKELIGYLIDSVKSLTMRIEEMERSQAGNAGQHL